MAWGRTVTCTAVWILGVAVAASVPADVTAKSRGSCVRAHSKTVDQNGFARVYQVRTGEGTKLYVCRRSTGKRFLLDVAFEADTLSSSYRNVRLAGGFAAWAYTSTDVTCKAACPEDYDPTTSGIRVYDLRQRQFRTVSGAVPLGRALVLGRRGGIAWASTSTSSSSVDIHGSVRPGEDLLIDSGNIDPRSLSIEITIISWRRDGVERFARLR